MPVTSASRTRVFSCFRSSQRIGAVTVVVVGYVLSVGRSDSATASTAT